jgi:hypothetical protein
LIALFNTGKIQIVSNLVTTIAIYTINTVASKTKAIRRNDWAKAYMRCPILYSIHRGSGREQSSSQLSWTDFPFQ